MIASTQSTRTKDAAETQELLSPAEVARRLGVGEAKVRRWIEIGQLRAVDLATEPGPAKRRRWRISEENMTAFAAARSNKTLIDPPRAGRVLQSRPKDATEFIQ